MTQFIKDGREIQPKGWFLSKYRLEESDFPPLKQVFMGDTPFYATDSIRETESGIILYRKEVESLWERHLVKRETVIEGKTFAGVRFQNDLVFGIHVLAKLAGISLAAFSKMISFDVIHTVPIDRLDRNRLVYAGSGSGNVFWSGTNIPTHMTQVVSSGGFLQAVEITGMVTYDKVMKWLYSLSREVFPHLSTRPEKYPHIEISVSEGAAIVLDRSTGERFVVPPKGFSVKAESYMAAKRLERDLYYLIRHRALKMGAHPGKFQVMFPAEDFAHRHGFTTLCMALELRDSLRDELTKRAERKEPVEIRLEGHDADIDKEDGETVDEESTAIVETTGLSEATVTDTDVLGIPAIVYKGQTLFLLANVSKALGIPKSRLAQHIKFVDHHEVDDELRSLVSRRYSCYTVCRMFTPKGVRQLIAAYFPAPQRKIPGLLPELAVTAVTFRDKSYPLVFYGGKKYMVQYYRPEPFYYLDRDAIVARGTPELVKFARLDLVYFRSLLTAAGFSESESIQNYNAFCLYPIDYDYAACIVNKDSKESIRAFLACADKESCPEEAEVQNPQLRIEGEDFHNESQQFVLNDTIQKDFGMVEDFIGTLIDESVTQGATYIKAVIGPDFFEYQDNANHSTEQHWPISRRFVEDIKRLTVHRDVVVKNPDGRQVRHSTIYPRYWRLGNVSLPGLRLWCHPVGSLYHHFYICCRKWLEAHTSESRKVSFVDTNDDDLLLEPLRQPARCEYCGADNFYLALNCCSCSLSMDDEDDASDAEEEDTDDNPVELLVSAIIEESIKIKAKTFRVVCLDDESIEFRAEDAVCRSYLDIKYASVLDKVARMYDAGEFRAGEKYWQTPDPPGLRIFLSPRMQYNIEFFWEVWKRMVKFRGSIMVDKEGNNLLLNPPCPECGEYPGWHVDGRCYNCGNNLCDFVGEEAGAAFRNRLPDDIVVDESDAVDAEDTNLPDLADAADNYTEEDLEEMEASGEATGDGVGGVIGKFGTNPPRLVQRIRTLKVAMAEVNAIEDEEVRAIARKMVLKEVDANE